MQLNGYCMEPQAVKTPGAVLRKEEQAGLFDGKGLEKTCIGVRSKHTTHSKRESLQTPPCYDVMHADWAFLPR